MHTYEIPFSIDQLFEDVKSNNGYHSYCIIDYSEDMSMDNHDSMKYFIDCVGIDSKFIIEDYGTQIVVKHPNHRLSIVIDAGGLGDFYSHSFECNWLEEEAEEYYYCANCGLPIEKGDYVCSGGCAQEMHEREIFN